MDEAVFRLVDPLEQPDGVARLGLGRARQERGDGSAGRVEEEGCGERGIDVTVGRGRNF